jgi:hypothetical protein
MIQLLDNLLRQLLIDQLGELTDEAQVSFEPPDARWRTFVANLTVGGQPANALNLYLVDLRENRKLRSNERIRTIEDGIVREEPAPARLDCHYLISAWSPAVAAPAVEPTLDEHSLLYQTAAVLFRHMPFNPSRVYPADSAALRAWPAPFQDSDLPAMALPVDGFNKLAEFWSGMGQGALWKPALYLIVTLPVALLMEIAGPMVTTRITEYRISGRPETAEVWIHIGGHVLSPARTIAVGNATVTNIAGGGSQVMVDNPVPFRVGDIVTANNIVRATITQIAGSNLTFGQALTGLALGNTLRIANILPAQATFRMTDVTGLVPGGTVLISGGDASNPGTTVTDRAVIESVAASGFIALRATPARTNTFNLNVAPANAPTLQEALPGIWVELQNIAGERLQTTQTNEAGRFTFGNLRAGSYRLRTQALGLAPIMRVVDVPSPSGEYDLQFT